MSYLVDTNVFSEAARPRPAPQVEAWLAEHEADLYVSVLTIGELRYGIEKLPRGRRKERLQSWLLRTCEIMGGRVLSVNASVSHVWGQLRARWSAGGLETPTLDGLIAATAKRHGLVLVTRNEKDLARRGVKLLNPFGPSATP
jgi:predicted nucleic acid-binding protein